MSDNTLHISSNVHGLASSLKEFVPAVFKSGWAWTTWTAGLLRNKVIAAVFDLQVPGSAYVMVGIAGFLVGAFKAFQKACQEREGVRARELRHRNVVAKHKAVVVAASDSQRSIDRHEYPGQGDGWAMHNYRAVADDVTRVHESLLQSLGESVLGTLLSADLGRWKDKHLNNHEIGEGVKGYQALLATAIADAAHLRYFGDG